MHSIQRAIMDFSKYLESSCVTSTPAVVLFFFLGLVLGVFIHQLVGFVFMFTGYHPETLTLQLFAMAYEYCIAGADLTATFLLVN